MRTYEAILASPETLRGMMISQCIISKAPTSSPHEYCFLCGSPALGYFSGTGVQAIQETWASHCDGFVAFSDVTDSELNTYEELG